jgi:hypothetical protein
MLFEHKDEVVDMEQKLVVRMVKKIIPVSKDSSKGNFFSIEN